MTFRAIFLAFGLAIASFGAISLVAPGEALAHPGHHAAPAVDQHSPSDDRDATASVEERSTDRSADGQCLNVCCVGSSCCPPTVAAQTDDMTQFPSAAKLEDFREALKPASGVEPIPEPPRSIL